MRFGHLYLERQPALARYVEGWAGEHVLFVVVRDEGGSLTMLTGLLRE